MKKSFVQRHAKGLIVGCVAVIVGLILFGAKAYLMIHFLVGNDIIIRLDVDKEDLLLEHGRNDTVRFDIGVTTNPFCSASCVGEFRDISTSRLIERRVFELRPGLPVTREYSVHARQKGLGQDLYRFDLDCRGVRTLLCHTAEEPTTRSILLTVESRLTPDEIILKKKLHDKLTMFELHVRRMYGYREVFIDVLGQMNRTFTVDDQNVDLSDFERTLDQQQAKLLGAHVDWRQQDYTLLREIVPDLDQDVVEKKLLDINDTIIHVLNKSQQLNQHVINDSVRLLMLRGISITNKTTGLRTNETITLFNSNVTEYVKRNDFTVKERLAGTLRTLVDTVERYLREEVLARDIDVDVYYDLICWVSGECVDHPRVHERSQQRSTDVNESCRRLDMLTSALMELNASVSGIPIDTRDGFSGNITAKIRNKRNEIRATYRRELRTGATNADFLRDVLAPRALVETEDYPDIDTIPALSLELVKQRPRVCEFVDLDVSRVVVVRQDTITVPDVDAGEVIVDFEEPPAQCCVFGTCRACCISNSCRDDQGTFPIVFLHGHSINKDVSADYSLEGFNKIQKRLENDGYLNAGAVTLFTDPDVEPGIWGLAGVPVTVRASYYFDIFKEPENYVVVQTKSENIDTYAIRLKELVDMITLKTGKSKVRIVAFSMGGLVARRYIQIFGADSVDKLILIGVPNKGVAGRVADFCPVIGEALECRDLRSDSLFLNKLNRGKLPDIPITNIVGTGCVMSGGTGDGTVLEKNAWLEGTRNHVVRGVCESDVNPLHLALRDIDRYPAVYDYVLGALEE